MIYIPAQTRTADIFQSSLVTDFVNDHYRRDIELYSTIKAETLSTSGYEGKNP
jgi:hypothetical protein